MGFTQGCEGIGSISSREKKSRWLQITYRNNKYNSRSDKKRKKKLWK